MNFMTRDRLISLDTLEGLTLDDCIEAIGYLVRFCGRGSMKFTVLEHSLHCLHLATEAYPKDYEAHLACLIHDIPEAVVSDIPTYVKQYIGEVAPKSLKAIHDLEDRVLEKLGLKNIFHEFEYHIKKVDTAALLIEAQMEFGKYFDPKDWPEADMSIYNTRVARTILLLNQEDTVQERIDLFKAHYNHLMEKINAGSK